MSGGVFVCDNTTQHNMALERLLPLVVRSPNIKASLSGAAADEGEWVGYRGARGRTWHLLAAPSAATISGRVVGRGNRPDLPEEGFGRRGRGRSVGGRSSLTTTNLRSLTTTNLRTRNEEEATAGGSVDFGGVGPSPTIVGGDDLTRRAAHARMDPVDGAFGLRGGGVSLDAGSDAADGVPR